MKSHTNHRMGATGDVVEDTKTLIAATAEVAEEGVVEARKRLGDALESAKDTYTLAQKKVVQTAKATDHAVRENPYIAMGIAFGLGAVIGFMFHRRD